MLMCCPLYRIKVQLEPLAIAANITQEASCRLDEVLLTFGTLYHWFHQLHEADDQGVRSAVEASLSKRWRDCEQEVYRAALILNPVFQITPFQRRPWCSDAGLLVLFTSLWKRFWPTEEPPRTLYSDIKDYTHHQGRYRALPIVVQALRLAAEDNVRASFLFVFIQSRSDASGLVTSHDEQAVCTTFEFLLTQVLLSFILN